ncbi:hypothetical protein CB1_000045010 [Camelus ferus]|nr:hypothetical protein CB1_000045010 [Camelus ferus]
MMMFRLYEGTARGQQVGKVVQVYRKKDVTHTEQVQREKVNSTTVYVGVHPRNVVITRLQPDRDREKILKREAKSPQAGKETGKY